MGDNSRESNQRIRLTCRDLQRNDCRPHEVRGAGHLVSQGGHRHGAPIPWRHCQGQPPLLDSLPSPTLLVTLCSTRIECRCCAGLPKKHCRTSPRPHCAYTRHKSQTPAEPCSNNNPANAADKDGNDGQHAKSAKWPASTGQLCPAQRRNYKKLHARTKSTSMASAYIT